MIVPLRDLLQQAREGKLQLPDFQRGWVWDDEHIVSLLASISLRYPIGAIMTLQTGNPDVRFRSKLIKGVDGNTASADPDFLLLDGQQRLTSLYLALCSRTPVPTKDSRGHKYCRYYYADIRAALDPDRDQEEEVIVSVPASRIEKTNFGRDIKLNLTTRQDEVASWMFPLNIVLDAGAVAAWMVDFLNGNSNRSERLSTWNKFNEEKIQPFNFYGVTTIQLPQATSKHAVCKVFEKVNTGGVTLTVFELLTATYAAQEFLLRDDWKKRSAQLRDSGYRRLLGHVKAIDFLQIVTLLSTFGRRRRHLAANPADDRAPAVSCKRRDVLNLELSEYRDWADQAIVGLKRAAAFLHDQCIFTSKDMPYPAQLIPLSAILGQNEGLVTDVHRNRLAQWLWCGVFGEMYGGATETRFANDVPECTAWLHEGGAAPRTVGEAQFQADRLLTLQTRNSAAYKGLLALQLKNGARDFRTGQKIDANAYFDLVADIHRIFPRRWCDKNGIDRGSSNCFVNKSAISRRSNQVMKGRSPSAYLVQIEKDGVNRQALNGYLSSHGINPVALRDDDFGDFFNKRFEWLVSQIAAAMGKDVNRNEARDESPFQHNLPARIEHLIAGGETASVEFKSTGRKDLRSGNRERHIEWAVVKTVAGLLNAWGGTLVVGVDDQGTPIGIEHDYAFVRDGNQDGWHQWLVTLLSNSLGPATAAQVSVSFGEATNGKTVALIDVPSGDEATFATKRKGPKGKVLPVRIGVATRELEGPELAEYMKYRWSS